MLHSLLSIGFVSALQTPSASLQADLQTVKWSLGAITIHFAFVICDVLNASQMLDGLAADSGYALQLGFKNNDTEFSV